MKNQKSNEGVAKKKCFVKIIFEVTFEANYGEEINIVCNIPEFGNWKIKNSL